MSAWIFQKITMIELVHMELMINNQKRVLFANIHKACQIVVLSIRCGILSSSSPISFNPTSFGEFCNENTINIAITCKIAAEVNIAPLQCTPRLIIPPNAKFAKIAPKRDEVDNNPNNFPKVDPSNHFATILVIAGQVPDITILSKKMDPHITQY